MARLIDADELIRIAGEAHSTKLAMEKAGIGTMAALTFAVQDAGFSTLVQIAEIIPTIDPESLRPRGHWEKETIDGPDVVKYTSLLSVFCSRCRRRAWMKSTYCPHCGAKMED